LAKFWDAEQAESGDPERNEVAAESGEIIGGNLYQRNWCAKGICRYMTLDQEPTMDANDTAVPTVQPLRRSSFCCGYFT
jgi:hypothetical protein